MMKDNLTFSTINVAQKTHTSRIGNISFQHKLSSEISVIGTGGEWPVCATLVDYAECHILYYAMWLPLKQTFGALHHITIMKHKLNQFSGVMSQK